MPRIFNFRSRYMALLLPVFIFLVTGAAVLPVAAQVVESGKFRLHKFQQPIGDETYSISKVGGSLELKDDFKFVDRGSAVPLTTSLKTDGDLSPISYSIKGKVSRESTIDDEVTVGGSSASVREGTETKTVATPKRFFTIAGYAPASVQMMLMRYLAKNKITTTETLPGGSVSIEDRGKDSVTADGKTVDLERYIVGGLIWGREWVWMDKQQNLVALVGVDAEFDHFEAIRDGYEDSLGLFISKSAADGMAALADMAAKMSPQEKGSLAIINANLIDGTGKAVVNNAVVVIENGRIKAVGPAASVRIPKGAKKFDAQGKYLLPGLWDMHSHFEQVEWGPVYLAAGVTTARDVGNEFDFIKSVRDAVAEGKGLGPRLLLAGIVDGDSAGALGIVRANNAGEAAMVVKRYHDANFQQIKIYSSVKPDVVKAICDEAHKYGMTVTGHIPNGMNAIQGVEAGMDQINHVQYVPRVLLPKDYKRQPGVVPNIDVNSPDAKRTFQFFKDHNTVFDPTMVIFEWLFHAAATPYAQIEPGVAKLPKALYGPINNTGFPPEQAAFGQANIEMYLKVIGALHQNGLRIVAGTDQTVPGHSLKRELELYVKAGFSPLEAIQAATLVPAQVMKVDKDSGTVEAGKYADLILVDGNPLDNISNLRNTKYVIANGKLFECAKLWTSVGFKP
ncbi:MAG: amidohydrolase family protein [Acidobacteriota bacterium]